MKSGVALIMKSLLESPENIVGVFYTGEEGPYEENGLNSLLPVLMKENDFEFSVTDGTFIFERISTFVLSWKVFR